MLAFIEIFYQNRFINKFARKEKAKFPESQSLTVSGFSCEILET